MSVALMVRPPRKMSAGIVFEELARYPLGVAVAPKHPLAKSKSVALAQIAREPLIAYSRKDYPEYHAMLEKLFAPVGRVPVSYTHLDVYKRQGMGIYCISRTNGGYVASTSIFSSDGKTSTQGKLVKIRTIRVNGNPNNANAYICLLYTSRCV